MAIEIITLLDLEIDKIKVGTVVDVFYNQEDTQKFRDDMLQVLTDRENAFTQLISDQVIQITDLQNKEAEIALQIAEAILQNNAKLLTDSAIIEKKKAELQEKIDQLNAEEAIIQAEIDALG